MTTKVLLRNVVDAIDSLMDGFTAYLNRETGEVYTVEDEEARSLDEGEGLDDIPDWQREGLAMAQEVLESEDWLALPDKFDVHEWSIMEQFADSIENEDLRRDLLDAIHGRGAFRYFRDTIDRYGMRDVWFDYKALALEKIAIEWLDEKGIKYERDIAGSAGNLPN